MNNTVLVLGQQLGGLSVGLDLCLCLGASLALKVTRGTAGNGRHSGRGGLKHIVDTAKILELQASDTSVMDALAECVGQDNTTKALVYFSVLLVWYVY